MKRKQIDPAVSNIAVVYARYSSHSQTEQSIEGQLTAAENYANAHGYTIIDQYIDRAVSGRTDERDSFQRMLADTAKHTFGVIIVWKIDRFGRNREEIAVNKIKCRSNGVRIEYVAENIGNGPESVLMESVFEGLAEYYSIQLSDNVKRGRHESAKNGKFCGGVIPYGFSISADKQFQINEAEAVVVRQVFDLFVSGEPLDEIAKQMSDKGYRTKKGSKFTSRSFQTLLRNVKYIGIYNYNDGEIITENAIPAIVSHEVFDEAQRRFRTKKFNTRKWEKGLYVLTGKLICGECGGALAGDSGKGKAGTKYRYYTCTNHKNKGNCKAKSIRAEELEEALINKALSVLFEPEVFDLILDKTWEYYAQELADDDQIYALEDQIAENKKSLDSLTKAIEAGVISKTITDRITELEEQGEMLRATLKSENEKRENRVTKEDLKHFLEEFRDGQHRTDLSTQNLIDTFIESATIYEDRIEIKLRVPTGKGTVDTMPLTECSDTTVMVAHYDLNPNIAIVVGKGYVCVIIRRDPARPTRLRKCE